ncbi:MAG: gamma-glutamylcyclotransferase [Desulfovibrio sp.]|nr:gamma-glutamylcyclotransferase [Desulfovibrio sp.]
MRKDGVLHYFAYGSNLDLADLAAWCASRSRCLALDKNKAERAFLPDYCLAFTRKSETRKGGVLDVVPKNGCGVWGVIFPVAERDLKLLDLKEGAPGAYRRVRVTVMLEDGRCIEAVTYEVVCKKNFVEPNSEYVKIVRNGYAAFNLPLEQLEDAVSNVRELLPLFVYGTLRRGFLRHSAMQNNQSQCIGIGSVEAQLYDTGEGYPCVVPGPGSTVGEIYTLPDSKLMDHLDIIEGYNKLGKSLFKRRIIKLYPFYNNKENYLWTWIFYSDEQIGKKLDRKTWIGDADKNEFCLNWLTCINSDVEKEAWNKLLQYIPTYWCGSDVLITDDEENVNDLDKYYGKKCLCSDNVKPIIWILTMFTFFLRESFGHSDCLRYVLCSIGEKYIYLVKNKDSDVLKNVIKYAKNLINEKLMHQNVE